MEHGRIQERMARARAANTMAHTPASINTMASGSGTGVAMKERVNVTPFGPVTLPQPMDDLAGCVDARREDVASVIGDTGP
jgi:hypothetical protein